MTEADDNVVGIPDLDRLFEEVLTGGAGTPDAPAWRGDLARLVHGARAEATPDELSGQNDIVARMVAIRQAAGAGAGAELERTGAGADLERTGVGVLTPAPPPTPATVPTVPTLPRATVPTLPRATAADAAPAAASDATGRGRQAGDHYVPRHARGYRAKHAAARTETAAGPTTHYLGRLIAMKAAAVTTAVVVGTVAAAAATTGLVANVVVPAFRSEAPDASPTGTSTTTPGDDGGSGGGVGDDDPGVDVTVAVPTCQLTPVCSPLTPASPGQGPAPARPTGPTVPTTEQPSATTTTTESPTTTTTTEVAPTTAPDPTTTTTVTPPTTEPEPASTMSASNESAAAP